MDEREDADAAVVLERPERHLGRQALSRARSAGELDRGAVTVAENAADELLQLRSSPGGSARPASRAAPRACSRASRSRPGWRRGTGPRAGRGRRPDRSRARRAGRMRRSAASSLLDPVDVEVDLLGVEGDQAGDLLALGQRSSGTTRPGPRAPQSPRRATSTRPAPLYGQWLTLSVGARRSMRTCVLGR